MKQSLTEYYELKLSPQQLTEATSQEAGQPMILKHVLVQRANAENRNKRIYPKPILEREFGKFNDTLVKENRALGELDHAESNTVNLKNVSHLFKSIIWEGDEVYADVEVLDGPEFPAGRIMAGLLRRKIPVGFSTRGMGSVEEISEGVMEVQDDFSLLTIDAVSFESTHGAFFKLNEGVSNIQQDKYKNIDLIIHDMVCENSGACSCMFGGKK